MEAVARFLGVEDFLAHRDALRRLALRQLGSVHDAEDVVQDVMLEVVRRPPENVRSPLHWLRSATVRTAARFRSRGYLRGDRETEAATRDEAPSFVELVVDQAALVDLARIISRLDEPYRTAIRRRYLEDADYAELATELGVSEATARSQVKRGLDHLRTRLETKRGGYLSLVLAFLLVRPRRAAAYGGAAVLALAAVLVPLLVSRDRAPRDDANAGARVAAPPSHTSTGPLETPDERASVTPRTQPAALTSGVAAALPPIGRLRGTVVHPGGRPAPGALIHASDARQPLISAPASNDPRTIVTRADDEGHFELTGVERDLWLWAELEGAQPSFRHRVDTLTGRDEVVTELRLGPASEPVSLEIVDEGGAPIVGAEVHVGGLAQPFWGARGGLQWRVEAQDVVTDAHGIARIAGPYVRLRVKAPGHAALESPRPPGDRLVLPRGLMIRGRVIDATGRPIPGARVVERPLELAAPGRGVDTNSSGAFQLEHVAPGAILEAFDPSEPARGSALAVVQESTLELRLRRETTLRGFARDASGPLDGWSVEAVSDEDSWVRRSVTTEADGGFAIHGVEGSAIALFLRPPGAGPEDVLGWTTSAAPGVETVELVARTSDARLAGTLDLSTLTARDLPSLVLRLDTRHAPTRRLLVDRNTGAWEAPPLPAGRYRIYALLPGTGAVELTAIDLAGDDPQELHLTLPARATLEVHHESDARLHGWALECAAALSYPTKRVAEVSFAENDVELLSDGIRIRDIWPGDYVLTLKAYGTTSRAVEVDLFPGETRELQLPLTRGFPVVIAVRAADGVPDHESVELVWIDEGGERHLLRAAQPVSNGPDGALVELAWFFPESDGVLEARTTGGLEGRRLVTAEEIVARARVELDLR